ncbi:NTF2-like N-terminal transpeptidase domain-containing protein, partial [Nocardioides hankookensis]
MRPLVSIAAVVLVSSVLVGCDAKDKVTGPDPDKAADALAAALATGDFADVALADDQTPTAVDADYAEVVDDLGDLTPTVTAGGVEENGDTATATLAWVWPVAGDEWSYTTDVTMTKVDDEWQVPWSRALVEPSLRKATVLDATPIGGSRGDIIGNRGTALVTDRDVVRFGIDRGKV